MGKKARYLLAVLRISLGWVFLWAFLDKLFGLGRSTTPENAWLAGGSPTSGFLSFSARGPLVGVFQGMAGSPVVDVLFMTGLLGLGLTLLLGIGLKVAGVAGPLLMLLLWVSQLPPAANPFMDNHIIYALVLALFPLLEAGHTLGLGRWWAEKTRAWPILQ
jgi:thiosulfate dehydrogenase [quinone] large subunit